MKGGCQCPETQIQQAYQRFLQSLPEEDQQGFEDLLTGQPDIDKDLIDRKFVNPEIRQKFKDSGIGGMHLHLTPEEESNLIFGTQKEGL